MTKLKPFILFILLQMSNVQSAWACMVGAHCGDQVIPASLVPPYVIVGIAMTCLVVGYFFFACFKPTACVRFVNEYWQVSLISEKKFLLFKNLCTLYLMVYLMMSLCLRSVGFVAWMIYLLAYFVITFLLCRKAEHCASALKLWWLILISICAFLLSFLLILIFVFGIAYLIDIEHFDVGMVCSSYIGLILIGFYLYCKKISQESSIHKKLYIAGMGLLAVVSIVVPIVMKNNLGGFAFTEYIFVVVAFYLLCCGIQQVINCKKNAEKYAWAFFCILIVGIFCYWHMSLDRQLFFKGTVLIYCDCFSM